MRDASPRTMAMNASMARSYIRALTTTPRARRSRRTSTSWPSACTRALIERLNAAARRPVLSPRFDAARDLDGLPPPERQDAHVCSLSRHVFCGLGVTWLKSSTEQCSL